MNEPKCTGSKLTDPLTQDFCDDTSCPRHYTEHDLRSPYEKNMDDENALKVEINSFVWMHAPGKMPLEKADELACKIFELFLVARKECESA